MPQAANCISFKAIVIHDAEDVVHPQAMRLLDHLLDEADFVQLPVLPALSAKSRWVSRHYADEFAESHGKALLVRQAVGAAIPAAGVGCAFRLSTLQRLADTQNGEPFDALSLTEDYELGLKIAEQGGRGVFAYVKDDQGSLICTREIFPERMIDAIMQKTRWSIGITMAGWDRMGWRGGLAENWMRLRDRRDPLAALLIAAAYLGTILLTFRQLLGYSAGAEQADYPAFAATLFSMTLAMLLWRLFMRAFFVRAHYGWREALLSVPRTFVANLIAIISTRRALIRYVAMCRGAPPRWDKTRHRFPSTREQETT